jgi:hypothetical protein
MNAQGKTLLAAAILLTVVAGVAIWEMQSARALEVDLSAVNLRRMALLSEARTLRASAANFGRTDQVTGAAQQEAPIRGVDTPAQQQSRVRIIRAWLKLRYAGFYRKEGLSPEQIVRFEDLSVNHFLRKQDIVATAQAENIPYSDPAIAELEKQENRQFQDEIAGALGSQISGEFAQYQRTGPVSEVADALAGNTFFVDALSAQQADQLTRILAENSAGYQSGGDASIDDLNIPAAFAQAQAILTPIQLAALRNLYDGTQASAKYYKIIGSLTQKGTPASPVAALPK